MNIDFRKVGSNEAQHVEVVLDSEAWVVTALEENLNASNAVQFGEFLPDLFV